MEQEKTSKSTTLEKILTGVTIAGIVASSAIEIYGYFANNQVCVNCGKYAGMGSLVLGTITLGKYSLRIGS